VNKLAEIPHIAVEVAKKVAQAGADYLVVQGFVGEKPVQQIMEALPHMKIILVSEMTHNDGGFTQEHLIGFAEMTKSLPVFGLTAPGNRPTRINLIKGIVGKEVKIIAAGVTEWQNGDDEEALKAGADLMIKGRSIMKILDEQINSTWFDLDWQRAKQNILIPTGICSVAAILLFLILTAIDLGNVTQKIIISASFSVVGFISQGINKRW
jgi:Ni,Fe-hydrogenase III small subunit